MTMLRRMTNFLHEIACIFFLVAAWYFSVAFIISSEHAHATHAALNLLWFIAAKMNDKVKV